MKTLVSLGAVALILSSNAYAEKTFYATVDQDSVDHISMKYTTNKSITKVENGIGLLELNESDIEDLSHTMHHLRNRCGGFVYHETLEEAQEYLNSTHTKMAEAGVFASYEINQDDTVNELMSHVDDLKIEAAIRKLSSFQNRYYKSQHGYNSMEWIRSTWAKMFSHRRDAKVEFHNHRSWKQPSVILTLKGESEETIVLGGHGDSIQGWFGSNHMHAPGADDNASGIATITEVIRVLAQTGYKPKKTLKFMAYAAEEVGLRGSKEIAKQMKRTRANVIGVMQLDMTNFKGSDDDISLISDNTNMEQNKFVGRLIDHYQSDLSWGYSKCGYACSDHASWHMNGFPASFPFEAKSNEMNKKIHTVNDTIDVSGGNALHAAKFAKLAVSFIVELDR